MWEKTHACFNVANFMQQKFFFMTQSEITFIRPLFSANVKKEICRVIK